MKKGVSQMCDSEELRNTFSDSADQIEDGWEIISSGDDGCWGTDLVMILRSPDGVLMEQTASCCSCYGIEDQWDPVETSLEALQATYDAMLRDKMDGVYSEEEALKRDDCNRLMAYKDAIDELKNGKP